MVESGLQETLSIGFVLVGACQQEVVSTLKGLTLPVGFEPASADQD